MSRRKGTIRLEGHVQVPRLPAIASGSATAIDHNDLSDVWKIAVTKFCEATDQDPEDLLRPLTREEIRQDIERTSARDKANVESKALANVVSGLLNVADLVVDAVSDVFAPVGICFKGVKVLFRLCAAFKRSFCTDALGRLLSSKSEEVMWTFREYADRSTPDIQAALPEKLQNTLSEIMANFLAVCTACINEAKESRPQGVCDKLRVYMRKTTKVIAGEAAAVQAQTGKIDALLAQFKNMVRTDTHLTAKETQSMTMRVEKGVNKIVRTTTAISNELGRKTDLDDSNRARIKKHLAFDEQNPAWDSWKQTYESLQSSSFDGTGDWIDDNAVLREWTDIQARTSTVAVALEGPDSSGKTHACFPILKCLGKPQQSTESQTLRANVAHFFFENSNDTQKSIASGKGGVPLRDALAGLVLQLTQKDIAFQSFVAEQCLHAAGTTFDARDIWENLIMRYFTASSKYSKEDTHQDEEVDARPDKIFFLLIDGLESARGSRRDPDGIKLVQHMIETITNQQTSGRAKRTQHFQVRLLITGTKEYLSKVLVGESIPRVQQISLCENNHADLEIFFRESQAMHKLEQANSRLKNKPLTHEQNFDVDAFLSKLIHDSKNNYAKLQSYLETVEDADDDQVESMLLHNSLDHILVLDSGQRKVKKLSKRLDQLSKRLDQQYIDDLNEILPWIVLPDWWPSIAQLGAVLQLKHRVAVKLEERTEKHYRSVLECKNGLVMATRINLDHFQAACQASPSNPEISPGRVGDGLHTKMEISDRTQQLDFDQMAMLQKIVLSVCGDTVFSKSGLDQFFNQCVPVEPHGVYFEPTDGHCRIILSLLKAVFPANREIAKSLHHYAIEDLLWHLGQVSSADMLKLSAERRKELGRWLFAFFMHEKSVRVWFVEDQLEQILSEKWWTSLDEVLRWFQDPEVAEGAFSMLKPTSSSMILEKKDLLERASEILASEWLLKSSWDAGKAFGWILQLPKELVDLKMSDEARHHVCHHPRDAVGITYDHVLAAEVWAQTKLRKKERKQTVWHTRVAETMVFHGIWEEVYPRCVKALDLDGRNWKAKWYMAQSLHHGNDHGGAMDRLQDLMSVFGSNCELRKQHSAAFEDIYKLFWDCARDSADETATRKFLDNFSGDNPMTDPDLIAFTLDQLKGPEYPSISIENFFHDLLERESGHGFVELLSKFADNKAFHENVSSALRNKPEILFQGYRKAIQKAQAMDCLSESALAHLRYYYAIALLYPRKATGGCCEVSVSRAIDGTKQRDKNISQARKALQTSIRRWIDQKRPREYEEVILGKTTRALGFAYVEWARTKPKSNGRIPKLESLKRQQDELLNEQDQRFSILVARTYRHLGQHSLVKQHTRELIQTAFNLLDDGLPDNDWSGYDLLAQALAMLDKRDDASAAWFLVSHSIEGDDLGENDDANDKNDSLGRVESDAAAWTDDDTTDRMVGFDGDSDEDEDEDDLDPDLGDSQDPERQSDEPKRLRNGVFFECDGNCGFSWQGRIEQDMYLCMDCANVRLDHACYESLKSGCLARRICSLDHEFLPVEKWTKERSMAVGRDKVQVGDETVSIQSWLDEIRKDYLSGEPAQEDIYSGKGEKIMVE